MLTRNLKRQRSMSFLKSAFYVLLLVLLNFGLFLYVFSCRGNVPDIHQPCQDSVEDTTKGLAASDCSYDKECLVRYSDHSFFSGWTGIGSVINIRYETASRSEYDPLSPPPSLSHEGHKTPITDFNGVHQTSAHSLLVESPQNQYKRISTSISQIGQTMKSLTSTQFPSMELVQNQTGETAESSTSVTCSDNKTFTQNSTYQIHLTTLISSLKSAASAGKTRFHNATVTGGDTDTLYGLYMCQGDVTPHTCRQCVYTAMQLVSSECPWSKEAIVWYDVCLLRYSNRSFFFVLETRPKFVVDTEADIPREQRESFGRKLEPKLKEVAEAAVTVKFARKEAYFAMKEAYGVEVNGLLALYTLAECTWDLSAHDCSKCLSDMLSDITSCCLGKEGGAVMCPSCHLRFKLNNHDVSTPRKANVQPRIIIIVVVLIVVLVVLYCFALYISRRKKSKSYKAILREHFGSEGTTLQSLQFSLATIEYATNKFSPQNRIGRGGFGEVYKGVLPDGREIAVKRLSRGSRQGATEFKNEVLLIAKLQHRNLVALLGFCIKEHEKILVYEYVPNKSLDYFLFGPQKERVLVWSERYKIIVGIARGILYLHQHSRLKVIHRDLKPSNILLDDEMNPKISDFGLAKMVAISETEGSTNRIVGTYGYMSPEYAMRGQFSEKSDVFSFGVIILEIVTGKKNASDHQDSEYIDYLLSYAWMQWRKENLLEIIDSNMNELSSNSEVIKCIQIGLLCVQANSDARPSMDTIVQYLNNDSVQLPFPREPAFFLCGQVEPTIGVIELGFGQHTDTVNQMSISNSFPR